MKGSENTSEPGRRGLAIAQKLQQTLYAPGNQMLADGVATISASMALKHNPTDQNDECRPGFLHSIHLLSFQVSPSSQLNRPTRLARLQMAPSPDGSEWHLTQRRRLPDRIDNRLLRMDGNHGLYDVPSPRLSCPHSRFSGPPTLVTILWNWYDRGRNETELQPSRTVRNGPTPGQTSQLRATGRGSRARTACRRSGPSRWPGRQMVVRRPSKAGAASLAPS